MSWRGLPVFGLFLFALAALMALPTGLAASLGLWQEAQAFGFCVVISVVAGALLSFAYYGRVSPTQAWAEFVTLTAVLVIGPALAALPIRFILPQIGFEAAYFEMVSALTTTGASVFDRPSELSEPMNLWRAIVGWFGGLIALVMAFALLAPRNLGGFEVRSALDRGGAIGRLRGLPAWAGGVKREAGGDRIASAIRTIAPIYSALTALLAVGLAIVGQEPFKAICSAFSIVSTSGIAIENEAMFADVGVRGEILVVFFFVAAASRHLYRPNRPLLEKFARFRGDPEMKVLLVVVMGATAWLFLRHFYGSLDLPAEREIAGPVAAIWGGFFTTLSFAVTAGVVSDSWEAARSWSGLGEPGLILIGLAVMGGGVASTAGGVKLLRAYALYKHGEREMERLIRPSSIAGSGAVRRGLRREGAQIAWVFLMLFLVTLGATMLALSLTGLRFEPSLTAAVAALSNTGPVLKSAIPDASWLTTLTPEARAVLVAAMILGRVETLALVAMLNPANLR
ncbi:MAG: potassium transporter TrkG [Pseudomonadota bacterium]